MDRFGSDVGVIKPKDSLSSFVESGWGSWTDCCYVFVTRGCADVRLAVFVEQLWHRLKYVTGRHLIQLSSIIL